MSDRESSQIEDPERARAMAEAENPHREEIAEHVGSIEQHSLFVGLEDAFAQEAEDRGDFAGADRHDEQAQLHRDEITKAIEAGPKAAIAAETAAERASREYDEQARKAAKRVVGSQVSSPELQDRLESLQESIDQLPPGDPARQPLAVQIEQIRAQMASPDSSK